MYHFAAITHHSLSVCVCVLIQISCRFKDAWSFATALDLPESWTELAKAALHHMDLSVGKCQVSIVFY